MGRPAKSIKVRSGAIASEDAAMEDKLRGKAEKPVPPDYLTYDQKEVFRFIVAGLEDAGVLGKLDVFVMKSFGRGMHNGAGCRDQGAG